MQILIGLLSDGKIIYVDNLYMFHSLIRKGYKSEMEGDSAVIPCA